MKNKTYKTEVPKENSKIYFHMDKIEATLAKKPYIIPASKSGTYSKLEKTKKELKEYTKY